MYSDSDSDFYGDDDLVADLELRTSKFDTNSWWLRQQAYPTPLRLQAQKQQQAKQTTRLHNPYADVPYAWQLSETVDDFLQRLPPATTDEIPGNSWIWICNPYIERKPKNEAQNQNIRGCEDEGPEEEGTNLARFIEGGMERLHFVSQFVDQFKQSCKSKMVLTRETNKAGNDAAHAILNLAQALRVRCGKWMLFCSVHAVNEVWGVIAKATAKNELGIGAKVATRSDVDQRTERLICVYTADFGDIEDVKRVALRLKQLGLVQPRGKSLYYKPDAYTYLGISSQNPWGVRASLYNTTDILGKAST
ncbi:uncharacterized protein BCR38DRAFT_455952 [Pseudomassariella vexata]|uniref:DUF1917-domain-containing protein n=1 Tax=Pseudomassariella vexata TaxID=1141098 RepID=A0A1Y2E6M1_9PEZI|nr:uncharacterized protein BCR38DRAFT_455952 [Pseudomassariella vexata]ORY67087.1 hypothetical protein BCR38DRAFT_455952 [Pseudomassariella vexata]